MIRKLTKKQIIQEREDAKKFVESLKPSEKQYTVFDLKEYQGNGDWEGKVFYQHDTMTGVGNSLWGMLGCFFARKHVWIESPLYLGREVCKKCGVIRS